MRRTFSRRIGVWIWGALVWGGCTTPHTISERATTRLTGAELAEQPEPERWPEDQHLVLVFEVTDDRGTLILHAGSGLFDASSEETRDDISEFDYAVDWDNDGVFDQAGLQGPVKYLYGEPGTYTVRLAGRIPGLVLCAREVPPASKEELDDHWMSGFSQQVVDVTQWGGISWRSMRGMFANCTALKGWSATDLPSLSHVTDTSYMFADASSFNQSLERWDVSRVTTMSDMFLRASSFDQPLQEWDVSRVTDMSGMFEGASAFNQPLVRWDVSRVTNMSEMFSYASTFDQPLEMWDVSQVTDMNGMFDEASSFNQSLTHWDVSQVTDMSFMFSHATAFNQPIARWNVSSVRDMDHMFSHAMAFDQPLAQWDVSQVIDMSEMFHRATQFDQSLAQWDVSHVTDMSRMFEGTNSWSQKHREETIEAWRALDMSPDVLDAVE